MAIVYGLKVNLSVAMVAMLDHTKLKIHAYEEKIMHNITISKADIPALVATFAANEKKSDEVIAIKFINRNGML